MEHLAIASVPMQKFRWLHRWPQALRRGTLFAELEKPWADCPGREGEHNDEACDAYSG